MKRRPVEDRFWEKVRKDGPVPEHRPGLGPCWIWTAALNRQTGYGRFWTGSTYLSAHCASWSLAVGPIQKGTHVLHKCDNRACVRPMHLFEGTALDNVRDMDEKRRRVTLKGEDSNLHVLTALEVCEIRELYNTRKLTQDELSAIYGVGQPCISRIVRNKRWVNQ